MDITHPRSSQALLVRGPLAATSLVYLSPSLGQGSLCALSPVLAECTFFSTHLLQQPGFSNLGSSTKHFLQYSTLPMAISRSEILWSHGFSCTELLGTIPPAPNLSPSQRPTVLLWCLLERADCQQIPQGGTSVIFAPVRAMTLPFPMRTAF